jgi:hypothetical protein
MHRTVAGVETGQITWALGTYAEARLIIHPQPVTGASIPNAGPMVRASASDADRLAALVLGQRDEIRHRHPNRIASETGLSLDLIPECMAPHR